MSTARMSIESMQYAVTMLAESAALLGGVPVSGDDIAVATRIPLGSTSTRAVGRFAPSGPVGYRAATAPDAPLRATRAAARADERAHRSPERSERIRIRLRAEKRIERAERYAARHDEELHYGLGATVRTVTS